MDGDQFSSEVDGPNENIADPKTTENIPPAETAQVKKWSDKIKASKKHFEKDFKRMKKCQQIAKHGAHKEWLDDESRYVAPIVNRHINQSVAQLYARDPKVDVESKKRLLHTVWDGTQEQIVFLESSAMMGDPNAAENLMALQADMAQAVAAENIVERSGETLRILHDHMIEQQPYVFKTKLKSMVRRTKTNGVSYIKVCFLRETEMRPEAAARAEDVQSKLKTMERLAREEGDMSEEELEEKRLELQSLQADIAAQPDQVVREQVVYDYPRSSEIVFDPNTRDLKTLEGCMWLAHQFELTNEEIQDIYGKDIESQKTEEELSTMRMMEKPGIDPKYVCYEIQNKYTQQVFVICEGYGGYLKPPAEPDFWLPQFFNIFPFVCNEDEHEHELYPLSDVWNTRHVQFEYNRSREALREHRIAARPFWLAARGRLERNEKERLSNHAAHEIVEINPQDPRSPISSVVERGPTAPLDPNLYEVESLNTDMLRTVGSQEANLGGTSGATATESSIAESSRMSSLSATADDLDDFLTAVARATGIVMLQMVSAERVKEIVGPGATWPELPITRKQLADQITLMVRAGSSGRPNRAAKLADMERAWPALSQIPGVNAEPLAEEYADLLDIDYSELIAQGVMSIVARNALAGSSTALPAAGPAPAAQGSLGGSNTPAVPQAQGAQPSYPESGSTI
ncbi:MAG: hypothetical protein AAGF53_02305 [Pseudomonadota bacterium]